MINKKNMLGKTPFEIGDKDAIHVAIVSVRAGKPVRPGQRCGFNEHREAVPDDSGPGVADPFRKSGIPVGGVFWMLLAQDQIPTVTHVWDHPSIDFAPPEREAEKNKYLERFAEQFGVTYEQLMLACGAVVETDSPAPYPGSKTPEELEALNEDIHDLWYEWQAETGHEFYNSGTECCPEYDFPECSLFQSGKGS